MPVCTFVHPQLKLDTPEDVELICAKAIRDGVLNAVIDHDKQQLKVRSAAMDARLGSDASARTRTRALSLALACAVRAARPHWSQLGRSRGTRARVRRGLVEGTPRPLTPVWLHPVATAAAPREQSMQDLDIYSTPEPQRSFHERINFCLDVHNEAVKACARACPCVLWRCMPRP